MKIKHLILAFAAATLAFASCDKKPNPRPTPPGPDPEPVIEHAGTFEDPFTVADAIAKCAEVGETATAESYYVVGKALTVDASGIAQYGNINVKLIDEGNESDVFTAFQILDVNKAKFTEPCRVNVGDELLICGPLVNYKSNTPETSGKGAAYLVKLNGEGPDPVKPGEPKGTGTEADPFNVAAAIAKCVATGQTETTDVFFVTGKVTVADESGIAQWGNVTLDLIDEGHDADVFKAFQINSVGGAKFSEAGTVKVGDIVVVKGKLVNYFGNTPETVKGTGELVSVNGQKPEVKPAISVKTATSINYDALEAEVSFTVNNPVAGQNVTITDIKDGGFATVTLEAAAVKVVFAAANETENAKEVSFTLKYQGASDVTCTVTQKVKPSGEEGATVTFEATVDIVPDNTVQAAWTLEKDGVKLECSNGIGGNGQQYRIYKSQTLKVSATNGKKVLGVEFTCTAKGDAQYGPGSFGELTGYTFADEVGTWTGEEESVVFTASNAQVRATKIVVTLSK